MPKTIFRDGVRRLLEEGAQLVDVLPPSEEYRESHLPGTIKTSPSRSWTARRRSICGGTRR